MNIYVGCGLTHVPRGNFEDYVRFIHAVVEALEARGYSVNYALRDSDPQLAEKPFNERARLCYIWDRAMVEAADVLVADATYPSTGLGIELQVAEARDIPVVLSFFKSEETRVEPVDYVNQDLSSHALQIGDGYVSLMALGVPSLFRMVPYLGGHFRTGNLWTVKTGNFRCLAKTGKFYFVMSSVRKSVWIFVRQLRGPHLRTWA